MDGAGGTSRCAVATKLSTLLVNALIWLPACRTSGGTAGNQELIQEQCNPPCCIRGAKQNLKTLKAPEMKKRASSDFQGFDRFEVGNHRLFASLLFWTVTSSPAMLVSCTTKSEYTGGYNTDSVNPSASNTRTVDRVKAVLKLDTKMTEDLILNDNRTQQEDRRYCHKRTNGHLVISAETGETKDVKGSVCVVHCVLGSCSAQLFRKHLH